MITSLSNGRIRHLVQLRDKGRARNKEGLFIAEGIRMYKEVPPAMLREVYVSESLWDFLEGRGDALTPGDTRDEGEFSAKNYALVRKKLHDCMEAGVYVERVSHEVFKHISDTRTPQGILFVMGQFSYSLESMVSKAVKRKEKEGREPLFLLAEDIQDPGNLGTMIRTAEGAGASGVILSKGTVDIYNPKTIRSTMGSLYRVPFVYMEELGEAVRLLQHSHITVYAAHLKGQQFYDQTKYKGGSAFLIGNEGNGLKKETAALADVYLKIPMEGSLESLNAAVASALLLYQAAGYARRNNVEMR
ncbi:MAG: RNA methyltransferase [Lachnospiraceae bacterium]|nr:RNA methyltransferase [Lachnospiraceae bacterium]